MTSEQAEQIWKEFVERYLQMISTSKLYELQRRKLFSEDVDRVQLFRRAFSSASDDRLAALHIAPDLSEEELKVLFPNLISMARWTAGVEAVRKLIKSLPRSWVLEHIEPEVDSLLNSPQTDDGDYRRFLELYRELDDVLVLRLAKRAANSDNPYIKEAGEDFLES